MSSEQYEGEYLERDLFPETVESGDFWVVKRNELIRGQYNLSASAQKVLASLLSLVNSQDENPLRPQQMTVSQFADLLGISRQHVYDSIDSVSSELKGMVARLPTTDDTGGQQSMELGQSFRKLGFFRECQYIAEKGLIIWEWEDRLEPYIRGFKKNFTKYQLKQIRGLTSGYSIRLYEILRSYHSIKSVDSGQRSVIRNIKMTHLREMLGIPDGRYTMFSKMKEKVLNVAQRELADTDLDFTYTTPERTEKRPRAKVSYIQFRITSKSPVERVKTSEGLLMTMTGHYGRRVANALIQEYGEERCRVNLVGAYKKAEKVYGTDQAVQSMPAYIRYYIQSDVFSTKGALDPDEYKDKAQAMFVATELTSIWETLSQDEKQDFIENRFDAPGFKDALSRFVKENPEVDAVDRKEAVRRQLRNIQDTSW